MQNTTEGLKARFYSGDDPSEIFVATSIANYIWSDPDYGGDDTISSTPLTYRQWDDMQFKAVEFLCEHTIKMLNNNTFIWL